MSISRHNSFGMLLCKLYNSMQHINYHFLNFCCFIHKIHSYIKRNLVIAASSGVKPLSGFADSVCEDFFYIHMNIFGVNEKFYLSFFDIIKNIFQLRNYFFAIFTWNDALLSEHCSMGYGTAYILTIHTLVEAYGGIKIIYFFIGIFLKPAAP